MNSIAHEIIQEVMGIDDKYHELMCRIGGLQVSFSKPTILFYYYWGMNAREIVMKTGRTEGYVREVIKKKNEKIIIVLLLFCLDTKK